MQLRDSLLPNGGTPWLLLSLSGCLGRRLPGASESWCWQCCGYPARAARPLSLRLRRVEDSGTVSRLMTTERRAVQKLAGSVAMRAILHQLHDTAGAWGAIRAVPMVQQRSRSETKV